VQAVIRQVNQGEHKQLEQGEPAELPGLNGRELLTRFAAIGVTKEELVGKYGQPKDWDQWRKAMSELLLTLEGVSAINPDKFAELRTVEFPC
jgi:hypothetical protein